MTDAILVPVSAGELFDKLSILQIKAERIVDPGKLVQVRHERAQLEPLARATRSSSSDPAELQRLEARLLETNQRLWDLENRVRSLEAAGDFGGSFVAAARQIYQGNDERAAVKREINLLLGSAIVEAKEHAGAASAANRR